MGSSKSERPEIDRDTIAELAYLARLSLTEEEANGLATDLATMVNYVGQLAEVDTDGAPQVVQAVLEPMRFRADEPRPSLSRSDALKSAPDAKDGYVIVPAVFEDGDGSENTDGDPAGEGSEAGDE